MIHRPPFRLGVEEEYLLVHQDTKDLVVSPDPRFMERCSERIEGQVTNEYLQCQVEVGTKPNPSVSGIAKDLKFLRHTIAQLGNEFGYAPIATSTHPFSTWREQESTPKERYQSLGGELGLSARRLLICGMHIHVEIEEEDRRLDIMKQACYFLPHLLAYSCSSPFWEGLDTSFSSYRVTVFDSLPRTGLPDELNSFNTYRELIKNLIQVGSIEDATKLWWDIRPSAKFPTLELRITDICSSPRDTLALVATYQSLISYLYSLRLQNQTWRSYPRTLINENRFRAQRYGVANRLIDWGKGELISFADLTEEIIDLLWNDAIELGCQDYMIRIRNIAKNGNSSDHQRRIYTQALSEGASSIEAGQKVVEYLIEEFLHF